MINDPISDMLVRIRNGCMVKKSFVDMPWSRVKAEVAKILHQEGFIKEFKEVKPVKDSVKRNLRITLRYSNKEPMFNGLRRISRPGLRRYVKYSEIPTLFGGNGVAIVSTSKGLMTGVEAKAQKLGGEWLCSVW